MQLAVRVPRQLKDRLEQAAAREGMHVSELVRVLLSQSLTEESRRAQAIRLKESKLPHSGFPRAST
ncbi:TPA: ribbon-helix-helix protein, CopG family [Stenotrophomonas maltophilia]|nr:ribbon-helix-helix protein, CopG family [Stenotrophomonas maltophilia]HDX0828591.1 ribbon-helix-helix protein, CopG family [Stenotrophomonas maltophilia]HDX0845741.1 ribbon-helix-helix protein, CopG family [Stenotrophomonas maltophilia]HDX0869574.1 ribbon-helix-helix protein, CopG family [Stenotrophomonas maltophilia]HEL4208473.1 ribbon-helix-helix protein, CopG family [Stenotrophomonas maltophilia]